MVAVLMAALAACTSTPHGLEPEGASTHDVMDPVRNADLKARYTVPTASTDGGSLSRPMLFPGSSANTQASVSQYMGLDGSAAPAAAAQASSGGTEFNFDSADIQTVAKSLLGDTLHLNYIVDPRVQGTVTLVSAGAIASKDVLPLFESALRMSNAAVVREGNLVKIVPASEATGGAPVTLGAGQPGFGVAILPLHYTSASTVAKMAESFLSRPGAIRADDARNVLLVQGTESERQSVADVVATFDVDWLRNQSVGIYPLKSTQPETMIQDLDRVFQANEGGQGQNVVHFQPISRMNAVMVVAKNARLLGEATQWIRRLDRVDDSGNTLRTYQLKFANAQKVAKILGDLFVGHTGGESAASQLAPGTNSGRSRLDSLDNSNNTSSAASGSANGLSLQNAGGTGQTGTATADSGNGTSPFGSLAGAAGGGNGAAGGPNDTSALTNGNIGKGLFQNVRITADAENNSIIVYSNLEDFRSIEHAIHDIDQPQLQVAIEATVAEVTLTHDLQFGVQNFLTSADLHLGRNNGSAGLLPAPAGTATTTTTPGTTTTTTDPTTGATTSVQTVAAALPQAFLQRTLPGFNLLLGPEAQPRLILSALSTITTVKVLSSPSLVALDDQPALLEVGDEIPVTTSSATLLSSSSTPVVNTIDLKNTGVILKVLPHIHANGSVQLEIEQEISNVVNPEQQTLTPTISERRIRSTVAINSGQTVLLGGLISEQENETKQGIPGLMQIKYLGDLFGSKTSDKQRQEIIVFIRPQVIRNGIDAQDVTEEFRERLDSMRNQGTVVKGKDVSSSASPAYRKF